MVYFGSPSFLGNDITNMNEEVLEIITNKELIALNQDKLCKQAEKVYDKNDIEVFLKPLKNGDWGVCILNRSEIEQQFKLNWDHLGIKVNKLLAIRDLWLHKNLKTFFFIPLFLRIVIKHSYTILYNDYR